MILRYLGCPEPPESKHRYDLRGLAAGQRYEVAEIFEMPGHLMAREVGSPDWPAPGAERFGIHPEWFEAVDEAIPIVSCGFEYNDTLCDFFGVLLDGPEHVEVVRALQRLDGPDESEPFSEWRERAAAALTQDAAMALFEWMQRCPYDWGVVEDALLIDPPLRAPFAYLGAYGTAVLRMDVRHADLRTCIEGALHALGIRGVDARLQDCCYWRGTGQARLVNARTPDKFLYGIRYGSDKSRHGALADSCEWTI